MGFFSDTDPGFRADGATLASLPKPLPEAQDTAAAAFRQSNVIASAYNAIANSGPFEPDPNHNPLDVVRGTNYERQHLDRFVGSRSEAETRTIMRRIDGEDQDRKTLEAAGAGGTLLSMLAGTLDPTLLLPGSIAIKAGREGSQISRAALSVGAAAGLQAGVQETALQASQETRPLSESVLNVGSATILGGLIGAGAMRFLGPSERAAMSESLDRTRTEMDAHAAGTPPRPEPAPVTAAPPLVPEPISASSVAQPAGAAASDTRQLVPVSSGFDKIPVLGAAVEKLDPMSRLFGAESVSARRAAADLAETPLRMRENLEGIPTTAGPALDRLARLEINQTRVAVGDELERLFSEYRFGEGDTFAPRMRAQFERFTGRDEGRMTFEQFKQEVGAAMQQGDKHAIPQVEQAAQMVRDRVFEPWKKRAIDAGLFPEDVAPRGAESYFQRLYNKQAIAAKRPDFVDRVTDYLASDQSVKAAAKDRITGYNRDLQAITRELEKAKEPEHIGRLQIQHDELRARIEEEIGAWQGNSAKEAQAAIKAREKYAATTNRAEEKIGRGPVDRLKSADAAVDSFITRVLGSDRDVSRLELRSHAEEITDRILGGPDGRLSYEMHLGKASPSFGGGEIPRGPLAERRFAIPDAMIADYLEKDVEKVMNAHLRTMVPDVMLTERFGDTAMTEAFRKINDDYAAMAVGKSEAALTRMEKERQAVIRDLAAVRDRIRGVYGYSSDAPLRTAARLVNGIKNYNVLTSMGVAAVSSLPDMAGAVFRHGLGNVMGDAWRPWLSSIMGLDKTGAWKEAKAQFRAMGIATETTLATRQHALNDITELYRPNSRLERTLQWGADKYQLVNLLAPWTDWGKTAASMVAGSEMLRAARAVSEGKATKRQITNLAESGIDGHMAERIWKSFQEGGEVRNGVHLPNTADWKDLTARRAFEGAVGREADIAIITPGQEKPLWISHPVIGVFGQFKSFTAAATQRLLIANLQRHDAQTLQGLIFSIGLGMLSYKLNAVFGGSPTSDRPQDWLKEAISRGGLLGWFEEGNALAAKASGGKLDIYRAIGADKPLTRYASRSALDQLLGPTSGKIDSLLKVTSAAGRGEWAESDTKALRRLMIFQNLFYLRRVFDQVEAGANQHFNVPHQEPKTKH